MPELPEVETTKNGLKPYLVGQSIEEVRIRQWQLRWPVSSALSAKAKGRIIGSVSRRAKYLLISLPNGVIILHLGMSGSLRIVEPDAIPGKHDHLDFLLSNGRCLRYRDPRRFGCILWTDHDPRQHQLLKSLGPEPFAAEFHGSYLYRKARNRSLAVKSFIMDSRIVVGVGNIYSNEALFRAGINPMRRAGRISRKRFDLLASMICKVLHEAIAQGGTTLRDFVNEQGKPGYFQQTLLVYDRAGQPCPDCQTLILEKRINQRSSFYCPKCQR